jgi:hypothetical protein
VTQRLTAALALLPAAVVVGCGSSSQHASPTTTTRSRSAITIAPSERAACGLLLERLRRVTAALQASSELIAHSLNKRQLSNRIGIEQVQLRRSAALLTGGPIPAALVPVDRRLVAALRAFSRDFGRAKAPAARGDFRAATAAMSDTAAVKRILAASKTIERACG